MNKPFAASGPADLFSRIDDYAADNASAAAGEGIVMTRPSPAAAAALSAA